MNISSHVRSAGDLTYLILSSGIILFGNPGCQDQPGCHIADRCLDVAKPNIGLDCHGKSSAPLTRPELRTGSVMYQKVTAAGCVGAECIVYY